MRYIADLHIHSRFSRACSPELTLPNIEKWCRIKGINIIGTGDFTHPQWFKEMQEQLEESEHKGLYKLKPNFQFPSASWRTNFQINSKPVYFICSTELSCIYSRGGRGRRVHHVVLAPSLETVGKIIAELERRGKNLKSDGRPILGIDSEELLKMLLDIDERILLIPAHAWTPWFAIFGSESGFDSIEECFGKMSKHIYAVETGLSSDPSMNWRLSALDKITLISNSDAHSLPNLGREVNVFDIDADKTRNSYAEITRIIKEKDINHFKYTIEFFPEEGKYHFDGHRLCGVRLSPKETKKNKGLCPACKKPVTVGAMNRIDELANREEGLKPDGAISYKSLLPLAEIIAEAFGVKSSTKSVKAEHEKLTQQGGSEFEVLLDRSEEELLKITEPRVVEAINRVRTGKLLILPGYDGEYGTVKVFTDEEQKKFGKKQGALF